MNPFVLELIGYIASALVAISLMMSSVLKLRVINLFGSLTFTIYGYLIAAYPVAAVNLFIVFINLFYLRAMLGEKAYFRILEVLPESAYLAAFLEFYRDDIRRFMPHFDFKPGDSPVVFFVLRDMVPAGLIIGKIREGGKLWLSLDYAIPDYRDLKIGRFVFRDRRNYLRGAGVRIVESPPGTREHEKYLRRMGFKERSHETGARVYEMPL